MRRVEFVVAFLIASIGVAVALQGQTPAEPSAAEVQTLLESPVLKDQAWGAWWVARQRQQDFDPQLRANLLAALEPAARRNGYWNQFVLDGTLDALIQTGPNAVPVDLLDRVYAQRREEALILAGQSSEAQELVDGFLRRVLSEKNPNWLPVTWLAAADLLLLHHVPDLVPTILGHVTFTARVALCDASTEPARCKPRRGGYGGSWPTAGADSSFPPWPHYEFVPIDRTDATPFIQGPTPASSLAFRRYLGTSAPPTRGPVTTKEQMAIVAAAAPHVAIPILDDDLAVVWHDDASSAAAVERFRQELVQRYSLMIRHLRDAGCLSAAEAASLATPKLEVAIDDQRTSKRPQ